MQLGRRGVAGLILGSMLAGISACGSERTALPGPDATAPPPPASTAVIPPTSYPEAFSGIAKATDAMPATAQRLAAGVVAAGDVRGNSDSAASALRSKLTHRLTLHVHLVGLAAESVLDTGPDSKRTKAAQTAVDVNSKALAKLIPAEKGSSDSKSASEESSDPDSARRSANFLTAWRTHVDDLAAFALAAREGIEPDKDDVRDDLNDWRTAAADNLKKAADGQVQSQTLRGQLGRYTKAMTNGIDALADKDGTGPERLRNAALAMTEFAESLGNGLARADDLDGDARDDAASVRAELTRLLTEHVVMTGAAVLASYTNRKTGGASSPEAQIAKAGLDENSKDFSERLRPAADPQAQVAFLILWRTVVNDFLDYAEAVRTDSTTRADAEVAALNKQRAALGSFLARVTDKKVPAATLSTAFKTHIAALTGAIQAIALGVLPARAPSG